MVRDYQDDASQRLGLPVHAWGLDDADLAELDTDAQVPAPRRPLDEGTTDAALIDEGIRWSGRAPAPADAHDGGWS
jgi:hypothetical protein